MPAVLVHGVPDTPRVWDVLRPLLDRDDVVTPRLPGFGCPRPDGFPATKEAYLDWLVGELDALDGPIDLVGHDWGAILVQRVASLGVPGLRSWAAGNGPIDPDYVWHDTAQLWQTPEVGERIMRDLITPENMQAVFETEGATPEHAAAASADIDDTMKGCILDLYRSAVDLGAEWGADLSRIDTPGLVLWGQNDPYVPARFGERLAERTGARLVELVSTHWWPLQRARTVGPELNRFWADLA